MADPQEVSAEVNWKVVRTDEWVFMEWKENGWGIPSETHFRIFDCKEIPSRNGTEAGFHQTLT